MKLYPGIPSGKERKESCHGDFHGNLRDYNMLM